MASVTVTVTSDLPDGAVTGTPSFLAGGASDPAITGLPSSGPSESLPSSENASDSIPTSASEALTSEGDAGMHTQVMPEGTVEDTGSIPKGAIDPLPHVMPGTGKPQTNPLVSAQENDASRASASADSAASATTPSSSVPSGSPMASPVIKRHWWRV